MGLAWAAIWLPDFHNLNPKDTLSWVRKDTAKEKTVGASYTSWASQGKIHSFGHLSKSQSTSVGQIFLKQDYSPIDIPSSETRAQQSAVFTE